jgi:hypothetical protein
MPKTIIPAGINRESTVSMVSPFFRAQTIAAPGPSVTREGLDRRRKVKGRRPLLHKSCRLWGHSAARPGPTEVNWLSCGVCAARWDLFDGTDYTPGP